jgi:2,4-dienoyl-CoA reductase (NADPH2)
VAVIGAGGIGFDVAEFLTHAGDDHGDPIAAYRKNGASTRLHRQARRPHRTADAPSPREVWLLQRKATKLGDGLAKTTGWARRLLLQKRGVHMQGGVEYLKIDDAGLHIAVDGKERVLDVDTVVICAGQDPAANWCRTRSRRHRAHAGRRRRRRGRTRRQARDLAGDGVRGRVLIRGDPGLLRMP